MITGGGWKAAAAEDTDVSGGSGGPASGVEQKFRGQEYQ